MRSTFAILICCLYALSAVEATSSSKSGSAEVQQSNDKPAKPLNLWSNDKSDVDDKDDKWSKDDCASRSVSILIGTSTYAIPCLQGDSIVNLNGLIPTPEASSSAVSSSSASSSEASSATDSTATTTDSTTTTTDTTTFADSSPTFTVTIYNSSDCTGNVLTTSLDSGCFDYDLYPNLTRVDFSVGTTSTTTLQVNFYHDADCAGISFLEALIASDTCGQNYYADVQTLSYSVITV